VVSERIHDDEPDTSEAVVRSLLAAECPRWADRPLRPLAAGSGTGDSSSAGVSSTGSDGSTGTDNALWRVLLDPGPDVVVRLPRRPGSAAGVLQEVAVLEFMSQRSFPGVATPTVRHVGAPHEVFPHPWSVLEWIEGSDAWAARHDPSMRSLVGLAEDLARFLHALAECGAGPAPDLGQGRAGGEPWGEARDEAGGEARAGVPVRRRSPGSRGGPILPLLDRLEGWLGDPAWNADQLIDVAAVRRLADEARELYPEPVTEGLVHGDLIPGNLLVRQGRLVAVLDWGGAGWADPAQDFTPAWALLDPPARQRFQRAVGADPSAWIRGRTFALEQAVGGVLYYVPRGHPLGQVMTRTLGHILAAP
jgi:aminoglycoside phosphotransferase (APT) family kinase protein